MSLCSDVSLAYHISILLDGEGEDIQGPMLLPNFQSTGIEIGVGVWIESCFVHQILQTCSNSLHSHQNLILKVVCCTLKWASRKERSCEND